MFYLSQLSYIRNVIILHFSLGWRQRQWQQQQHHSLARTTGDPPVSPPCAVLDLAISLCLCGGVRQARLYNSHVATIVAGKLWYRRMPVADFVMTLPPQHCMAQKDIWNIGQRWFRFCWWIACLSIHCSYPPAALWLRLLYVFFL